MVALTLAALDGRRPRSNARWKSEGGRASPRRRRYGDRFSAAADDGVRTGYVNVSRAVHFVEDLVARHGAGLVSSF